VTTYDSGALLQHWNNVFATRPTNQTLSKLTLLSRPQADLRGCFVAKEKGVEKAGKEGKAGEMEGKKEGTR